MSLAGRFSSRVDPDAMANTPHRSGMIEHVRRAFGKDRIAPRMRMSTDGKPHIDVVLHIDVCIDDDQQFDGAQPTQSPQRIHHLPSLHRKRLSNTGEPDVTMRARIGQSQINQFRNRQPHQW